MQVDLIGHRNLRDLIEERTRLRGDKTFLIFESRTGEVRRFPM
jgi:hypothetical protein